MLYDNGQLLELLAALWRETRRPLYRQRAEETVAWLAREMIAEAAPDGLASFAAALDADSEGEEGRFYVWSEAEVDRVLGDAAPAFKAAYDVTRAGNWEGHSILNLLEKAEERHEADPALAEARAKLFEARAPRIRPQRDDKVLADWTALAVIGLADAARAFDRPDWIDLAARAFDFVATHMTDGDDGLSHSYRLGRAAHPGGLLDYAAMARAGVALYEATGTARYLDQANAFADAAERRFAAPDGGWFDSTAADLIVRPKTIADNATPSGAGMMAETLARLWLLTGAETRRSAAERALTAYGGEIARGLPAAGLIAAERLLARGLQVVVIGADDDPVTAALLAAAERASLPDLVLTRLAPDAALPGLHPAHGKAMLDGR
ncbi:MAG: thioredoxin domain-containing protein, partial [Alphaproteobacteria bacterium]